MKGIRIELCAGLLLAAINGAALAQAQPSPQPPAGTGIPVTADNFVRAETDEDLCQHRQTKGESFGKF